MADSRKGLSDGPRWLTVVLVALALLALVDGCRLWWPRTVDDSFIVFRYAQNLVDGFGPVYNVGQRVEGYSNPAWVLLAVTALALGLSAELLAKLVGAASALVLCWLSFCTTRRLGATNWGAALAALLLGSSLVLQIWAVAGLETDFYALLLFAGLSILALGPATPQRSSVASLLLVGSSLTRPEGLMFWGLGLLLACGGPTSQRVRRVLHYAAPGLVLALHLAWRLSYYGELLPNTYHVKTGGGALMWRQGFHGLTSFVTEGQHLGWLVAAALGVAVGLLQPATRRATAIFSGAVLLQLLWLVSVGDDGLRVHRFYVPALAPLACLVGLLFSRGGSRSLAGVGVVAIATASTFSAYALRAELVPRMRGASLSYQRGNVALGRHLAATREPDTRIAVAAAGAIPFYSQLPTIDLYGLNDRHIARVDFPARGRGRLMKWDHEYVLRQQPDVIVINRGYFGAGDPQGPAARRDPRILAPAPMDRDLFRHVLESGDYALRPLALDDGALFWVFERNP